MCPSGSTSSASASDTAPVVTLFLTSGEVLNGEILSGDGNAIVVGLPASKRGRIPLGKPMGFELQGADPVQRLPVVATRNDEQDSISTVRLVLSNRALIGGTLGSAQTALFNERATFRLPVRRDSVSDAKICAVTASARAPRLGGTRASIRGPRHSVTILDVSFDGLGVRVSKSTHEQLTSASDVHIELETAVGLIVVEGAICHRQELPRGGGVRYGVAAGSSTAARWRDEDERSLRRFVTEQQRASLERLRRA
jgi:hypothetical protein